MKKSSFLSAILAKNVDDLTFEPAHRVECLASMVSRTLPIILSDYIMFYRGHSIMEINFYQLLWF